LVSIKTSSSARPLFLAFFLKIEKAISSRSSIDIPGTGTPSHVLSCHDVEVKNYLKQHFLILALYYRFQNDIVLYN
jgi:hypothetical protein